MIYHLSACLLYLHPPKVMAYVLSDDKLRQHLETAGPEQDECSGEGGGEGGGVAARESPEDLVEVLCGDRVVEAHLYVGDKSSNVTLPWTSPTVQ